jgi:hypothetical protein
VIAGRARRQGVADRWTLDMPLAAWLESLWGEHDYEALWCMRRYGWRCRCELSQGVKECECVSVGKVRLKG